MKVLAKRANGIFIVTPIVVALFIILTVYLILTLTDNSAEAKALQFLLGFNSTGYRSYRRAGMFGYYYWGLILINVGCIASAIRRIFIPKVIIEYDNCGLYIYRRFKPVKTIRYEFMQSRVSEVDLEEITVVVPRYRYGSRLATISNPLWDIIKTGTLRIETADEIINLHGIKNVKEVEIELNKIIKEALGKRYGEGF